MEVSNGMTGEGAPGPESMELSNGMAVEDAWGPESMEPPNGKAMEGQPKPHSPTQVKSIPAQIFKNDSPILKPSCICYA